MWQHSNILLHNRDQAQAYIKKTCNCKCELTLEDEFDVNDIYTYIYIYMLNSNMCVYMLWCFQKLMFKFEYINNRMNC